MTVNYNVPSAERKPKTLSMHGVEREDPYYWLNRRDNPDVIDYLNRENNYTELIMKEHEDLQLELYEEMKGRLNEEDVSAAYFLNGYWYYRRYEKGGEYPIHCRKKNSMDSAEQILLDVNAIAEGHDYCSVSGLEISQDCNLMIYGVDYLGDRTYSLRVKDLNSDSDKKDVIAVTTGRAYWGNDNRSFFYVVRDEETLRPFQVFKHILGQSQSEDTLVYEEKDDTYDVTIWKSKSQKYIFIISDSTLTTEYHFIDADSSDFSAMLFTPRKRGIEYHIEHLRDSFYIVTNFHATNFRVMETSCSATEINNWKELIPHDEDVLIEDIEVFIDYYVLSVRKCGMTALNVRSWDGNIDYYLEFTEECYTVETEINLDINSSKLRYDYTSFTTPYSIFEIDMGSKKTDMLKQRKVMGEFSPEDYVSRRFMAKADDGASVPISIVSRKGAFDNGPIPLLLYGYGSYGCSIDPAFQSSRLSLLDRGFAFAIAHIRGGQEFGRYWYEQGKLLSKKNTFTDFINCGKYLVKQGLTNSDMLFATGGSAGGLLIGAVINMYPELFRGVIAEVPFVDVVTTMLDETIPLTTGEYDEWGNPNDKEYFDYMLEYSPYDNIARKDYPNIFITSGLYDSQVQYWEPAKWVAKLRYLKTDSNLLLFKTDMSSGHGGKSGRYKSYLDLAQLYAFLLSLVPRK